MDVLSRNRYYRQQKKAGALMPPAYPTTTYYKYPNEVKIHPEIEKRRWSLKDKKEKNKKINKNPHNDFSFFTSKH